MNYIKNPNNMMSPIYNPMTPQQEEKILKHVYKNAIVEHVLINYPKGQIVVIYDREIILTRHETIDIVTLQYLN